jgi:hypothetical protein
MERQRSRQRADGDTEMRTRESLQETRPLHANLFVPKRWKPGMIHFTGVVRIGDGKFWVRVKLCETRDGTSRLFARLELTEQTD